VYTKKSKLPDMKNLILFISLLAFSGSSLKANDEFDYQTLKDRRQTVKLPTYPPETKLVIIEQTEIMLGDLFVHRQLKLKAFGKKIDPLPKLASLKKK
jgi:hypothetical protein